MILIVEASFLCCDDNESLSSLLLLYQKQRYAIAVIDAAVAATTGSRIRGRVTMVGPVGAAQEPLMAVLRYVVLCSRHRFQGGVSTWISVDED